MSQSLHNCTVNKLLYFAVCNLNWIDLKGNSIVYRFYKTKYLQYDEPLSKICYLTYTKFKGW